ncbi:ATP-binding protein [Geomonas ferrireducens]|uniref:ATP-binding protein n=1 Tax=Geomonas ferrireducens TaxID=2570227 RepID=UPI0010A8971A|nr:ATP-binding protein [Geomonas ferrireducens]
MVTQISTIRRFSLMLALLWSAGIAVSFAWFYKHEQGTVLEIARAEARATYEKDSLYRRWATKHGGVYVAVSPLNPPNPNLAHISERDIATPSGRALTLVNPAYMTRQVFELADSQNHLVRGHITSLKPIRPENAPDPWEARALQKFEQGAREVSEVQMMNGRRYMRLMRPFVTEEGCLKCHADQGYKVGDIRGGISASVPIESHDGAFSSVITGGVASHAILWFLGIGMIGTGSRVLTRSARVLEKSEERYRTVADYTDDWEYWQAPDRTFMYVSPSCKQLCGYGHEAFYADHTLIERVIHPDDLAAYLDHEHASFEGNPKPIDFRIVRPDGEVRWISHICRVVYTKDGAENGVRASNRDITDRKRADETLREQALLLESEVRERKERELELEAKNAELERFTYTVSHDLKSPLITIKGFAGAVIKDLQNGQSQRFEGDVRRIMAAADKMTALLDDLLELSRVGRIVNPPTLIDMNALAHEVLAQLAGPLEQRGVEVLLQQDLPTVWGDQRRICEVLQNLLENAIKYAGEQPHPCIEVGKRDGDGSTVFTVRDNGMGVAQQYHETIFGLFNKLDARSEGTGIGLALARRIVEFHGGKLWVESDGAGQGSTFCFTLNMMPPAAATES